MPRAKRAAEVPTDPLDAMLTRLQLTGIRDQLDSLLDEAARSNLSAAGNADHAVRARDLPQGSPAHRHGFEARPLPGPEGACGL